MCLGGIRRCLGGCNRQAGNQGKPGDTSFGRKAKIAEKRTCRRLCHDAKIRDPGGPLAGGAACDEEFNNLCAVRRVDVLCEGERGLAFSGGGEVIRTVFDKQYRDIRYATGEG